MAPTVPAAFISYARFDDEHDGGYLTNLRAHLSKEVQAYIGKPFEIFQDNKDIKWGQQWKVRITDSLDTTTFLISIISPSFFTSAACREEFQHFLIRENRLGRNDLILPIYYIECSQMQNLSDPLAQEIGKRQWADWRSLRHKSFKSAAVRKTLTQLAKRIAKALSSDGALHSPTNLDANLMQSSSQAISISMRPASNSTEFMNQQIRGHHFMNKADDAMAKDDFPGAQSHTEKAVELCPEIELEARSKLALWMSEKAVTEFADVTRGAQNPRYQYYFPDPNSLSILCSDTIRHLTRTLKLLDHDQGLYLAALTQLHGVQGRYNDMMPALRDAVVGNANLRAVLAAPQSLAALSNGCAQATDPEIALHEMGRALEIQFPCTQSDVIESVMGLSLSGLNLEDHNVYWYVVTKPFVSDKQAIPFRVASLHIRGHDVGQGMNTRRLIRAFCHIPGLLGPIQQYPVGPEDETAQRLVSQLAEKFIFISKH